MGEAQNSKLDGQGKMAVLLQLGKLDSKRYGESQWNDLTAADQLFIDQEYDKIAMAVGTDQKAQSEPT